MLNVDLHNRTYTAEVLRAKSEPERAASAISRLGVSPRQTHEAQDESGAVIALSHAYLPVPEARGCHRSMRSVKREGKTIDVPQTRSVRGRDSWLYDLLVAQSGRHIVVAVPFHGLAEQFFVRVDTALAGTRTVYEKLDITKLIIEMGPKGVLSGMGSAERPVEIQLTRCQLAYSDPERSRDLQQVRMTGANLGASEVYRTLVSPVLNARQSKVTVTPVLLGCALSVGGVKKCSATTDRHGNFKLWVGPGLRQVTRVFELLSVIERVKDVTGTTSNIPILQSDTIRDSEV